MPQVSESYPRDPFSTLLPVTFSKVPGGLRARKPFIIKCWGRKCWPLINNDSFLPTHLNFLGGLERKTSRARNPLSIKAGRIFLEDANKAAGVPRSFKFSGWSTLRSALLSERHKPLPCTWSSDLAL